jgi:hypothetical protein
VPSRWILTRVIGIALSTGAFVALAAVIVRLLIVLIRRTKEIHELVEASVSRRSAPFVELGAETAGVAAVAFGVWVIETGSIRHPVILVAVQVARWMSLVGCGVVFMRALLMVRRLRIESARKRFAPK